MAKMNETHCLGGLKSQHPQEVQDAIATAASQKKSNKNYSLHAKFKNTYIEDVVKHDKHVKDRNDAKIAHNKEKKQEKVALADLHKETVLITTPAALNAQLSVLGSLSAKEKILQDQVNARIKGRAYTYKNMNQKFLCLHIKKEERIRLSAPSGGVEGSVSYLNELLLAMIAVMFPRRDTIQLLSQATISLHNAVS